MKCAVLLSHYLEFIYDYFDGHGVILHLQVLV